MSKSKYIFRCSSCDSKVEILEGEPIPTCCKKIMIKDPLDQCTTTEHPEMVRNYDDNDPCDDGRGKES